MTCTTTIPVPGALPNVTVGFYREDEFGVAVPTNRDFTKARFLEQASCLQGEPAVFDFVFELDAPETMGTTDRLSVLVVASTQASSLPEQNEDSDTATLNGSVRLREFP